MMEENVVMGAIAFMVLCAIVVKMLWTIRHSEDERWDTVVKSAATQTLVFTVCLLLLDIVAASVLNMQPMSTPVKLLVVFAWFIFYLRHYNRRFGGDDEK